MLVRSNIAGARAALDRFGVKVARGMTTAIPEWSRDMMFAQHGMPSGATSPAPASATHPSVSWSDFNRGAQQHVADAANPSAAAMAPQTNRRSPLAPHLGAPPSVSPMTPPGAGAAAAAAPAAAAATSRFKLPGLGGAKRMLGLGALGALGAGAWGLHKQHQRDLEGERLTYAPMQGGFY